MAVPKFFMFFKPFLEAIGDGELHAAKEVRQSIAAALKLSEEDMTIMLPSGRQAVYANRINWARTYLDKAGLIETPIRAKYRITKEGKKALQSGQEIDLKYLEQYDKFREFHQNDPKSGIDPVPLDPVEEESPTEILGNPPRTLTNPSPISPRNYCGCNTPQREISLDYLQIVLHQQYNYLRKQLLPASSLSRHKTTR